MELQGGGGLREVDDFYEFQDKVMSDTKKNSGLVQCVCHSMAWSKPCHYFKPKFKDMAEQSQYDNVEWYWVEGTDSASTRRILTTLGITSVPVVQIWKDGQMLDGVLGKVPQVVEQMVQRWAEADSNGEDLTEVPKTEQPRLVEKTNVGEA